MSSIFILGATGYIGGQFTSSPFLMNHLIFVFLGTFIVALKRTNPSLNITALVRSPTHFPAISAAGATPVQGDFSEHDKLADLAEQADVVVNAADADDIKVTDALLKGLKRRKEGGKGVGALVHVSGTAVFMVEGSGKREEGLKVWDVSFLLSILLHAICPHVLPSLVAGSLRRRY